MEYTLVELPERHIIGPTIRTGNNDPACGQKIGQLWQQFMENGMFECIPDPILEPYSSYGLYYRYDFKKGEYDTLVGCESSSTAAPQSMEIITIPAGKYAKFSTRGDVVQAVIEAWDRIWAMDDLAAQRAYTVDFEAYRPSSDMKNTEIDLFIALK